MRSSSLSSDILHRRARIAAETRKLIDRLATWVLVLALASSVIIVVFWLVAWFENSVSLAGAQKPLVSRVVFDGITHCEGCRSDAFGGRTLTPLAGEPGSYTFQSARSVVRSQDRSDQRTIVLGKS